MLATNFGFYLELPYYTKLRRRKLLSITLSFQSFLTAKNVNYRRENNSEKKFSFINLSLSKCFSRQIIKLNEYFHKTYLSTKCYQNIYFLFSVLFTELVRCLYGNAYPFSSSMSMIWLCPFLAANIRAVQPCSFWTSAVTPAEKKIEYNLNQMKKQRQNL